jgi:hypothetical protein
MSVNPFDIKTVLLVKHAQHVALIHYPMSEQKAIEPIAARFSKRRRFYALTPIFGFWRSDLILCCPHGQ